MPNILLLVRNTIYFIAIVFAFSGCNEKAYLKSSGSVTNSKANQKEIYQEEGTAICKEEVLHISNANDLLYFAAVVNGTDPKIPQNEQICAVLDNDIDLSSVCGEKIGSWTPIGYGSSRFKGVFDGQNHTISNIYIKAPDVIGHGLFGLVKGAEIRNLTLGHGYIYSEGECTGGIVGVGPVKITNCHNYANITSNHKFTGGIIGYQSSNGIVERCHNEGDITGLSHYPSRFGVGGIAGATYGESVVADCYNLSNISGNSSRVGGIVGSAENCEVRNCYSYANVVSKNNDYGGGICAIAPDYGYTVVKDCYHYNGLESGSQQNEMIRPKSDFNNGTVFKLLDKKSPNVWRQEKGKYPVFK